MKTNRAPRAAAVAATGARPCRVWLVEDHASIRQLLEDFVQALPGFALAGSSADASSLLEVALRGEVDVVILDLMIPGEGGMVALERLSHLPEAPRVVIFSATATADSLKLALSLGAHGYVDKSDPIEELRTALQRVQAGGVHFSRRPGQVLATLIGSPPGTREQPAALELRVLELLARGCSIKEAAHELQVSAQRVYRVRQTLMERARARSAQDLTRYAIELGLVGIHRNPGGQAPGAAPSMR